MFFLFRSTPSSIVNILSYHFHTMKTAPRLSTDPVSLFKEAKSIRYAFHIMDLMGIKLEPTNPRAKDGCPALLLSVGFN